MTPRVRRPIDRVSGAELYHLPTARPRRDIEANFRASGVRSVWCPGRVAVRPEEEKAVPFLSALRNPHLHLQHPSSRGDATSARDGASGYAVADPPGCPPAGGETTERAGEPGTSTAPESGRRRSVALSFRPAGGRDVRRGASWESTVLVHPQVARPEHLATDGRILPPTPTPAAQIAGPEAFVTPR